MNNKALLLLIGSLLWSQIGSASFAEKTKRYLSPKDMFSLLQQKFPVLLDAEKVMAVKPSCWALGATNTNVTGLVNPAIGLPATTEPGAGFVRWWGSCVDTVIARQFLLLTGLTNNQQLWGRYFAPSVLDKLRDSANPQDPFHQLRELEWSTIPDRIKDDQVRFLVEEFIGPNPVIKDLGFAKGTDDLAALIKTSVDPKLGLTIFEANQKLILALMMREEFLTY